MVAGTVCCVPRVSQLRLRHVVYRFGGMGCVMLRRRRRDDAKRWVALAARLGQAWGSDFKCPYCNGEGHDLNGRSGSDSFYVSCRNCGVVTSVREYP